MEFDDFIVVVVVQQVLCYVAMYIVGNEELIASCKLIRRKLLAWFIRLANLPYSSSDSLCEVFMLPT
jgi:hypothetical protein